MVAEGLFVDPYAKFLTGNGSGEEVIIQIELSDVPSY